MPTKRNKFSSYAVYALGCQQNWYDAERLAYVADGHGLFPAPADEADLVIVLACSVRQKATDRLFGLIEKWRQLKPRTIILGACVLPADQPLLKTKVDHLVIGDMEAWLTDWLGAPATPASSAPTSLNFTPTPDHAFIPITSGCNNFCTFCAVPLTRGRETSRPVATILAEIKRQIAAKKTAITLLGQNVNSYGLSDYKPRDLRKNKDKSGAAWSPTNPSPFVLLLREIEKLPGLKSLSFLSPNPQDIAGDLIDWMKQSKIFSRTLNLPLQSGSDRILKLMNRRYSRKEYLDLVTKIRQAVPDIIFSTDIIVGFPGETAADFQKTVAVAKEVKFSKAFLGIYSPRPGTTAAKLYPDDIPAKEKHRRWSILNDLLNKTHSPLDAHTAGRFLKSAKIQIDH